MLASRILTSATRRATAPDVTVNSLVAKVVSQTETAHDTLALQMSAFDPPMKTRAASWSRSRARGHARRADHPPHLLGVRTAP